MDTYVHTYSKANHRLGGLLEEKILAGVSHTRCNGIN